MNALSITLATTGKAARTRRRTHASAAIPFAILALALAARAALPDWGFMWCVGYGIFLAFKVLTLLRARRNGIRPSLYGALGYVFLWVGMDPEEFFAGAAARPNRSEWAIAAAKTAFGVALFWIAAPLAYRLHPHVGGWTAVVGLGFLLHFGGFHLLSLAWRRGGFGARHIMNSPARARSVADFWSARWNLAFRRLAHDHVFAPISRLLGSRAAEFAAFLFSGLVHEMVISVPARGGYGLPTLYFLIQWLGAAIERGRLCRRIGLRRGGRGWIFAMAIAAAPAYWLFHPVFIDRIIIPFMGAVGAL